MPYSAIASLPLPAVARVQRIAPRLPAPHCPDDHVQLWICLRGPLRVDTVDGRFTLARRDVLTLPADHHGQLAPGNPGAGLLLAIPRAVLQPARKASSVRRARAMRPLFATHARADLVLLRQALQAWREGPAQDWPLARAADLLQLALAQQHHVATWLQRIPGRSESHRHHALQRLLRARNRIVNMPFERHDLDTLAIAANYSKSHFIRMFRDVFGVTPGVLLATARIDMAKSLIVNSDLAIAEIAADVGYENRFAFSRLFKKRVGVSASNFRSTCAMQARA